MPDTALVVGAPAPLAGLFDPAVQGALTSDERSQLVALLSRDDTIGVTIPETIDDANLWDALQVCCKVEGRVREVQSVIKRLIGRALVLMEGRPEIYRSRGFVSLDALMTDETRGLPAMTGISRSELYNAKRIATAFPTMPMSDYREVGFSKLLTVSKIAKEGDSTAAAWVEAAKTSTLDELREKIYRSNNGIAPGSLELDSFMITLNKDEKARLNDFLKNPRYQAYCATASPAAMLLRAIEESTAEWELQMREQEARQGGL